MELNLSAFFAAIRINVFNFNDLWDIFHNVYELVNFINLNAVNYLLLEKLEKSRVDLF